MRSPIDKVHYSNVEISDLMGRHTYEIFVGIWPQTGPCHRLGALLDGRTTK